MSLISRNDRGLMADWWWTIDRWLLAGVLLLMAYGVLLCLAASPAVAQRLGYSEFHFVKRQLFFIVPALGVLVASSFLAPHQVRRLGLGVVAVGFVLLIVTLGFGAEVKGAKRWLDLGAVSIQPSEFVKPAFVVVAAWLFSEGMKRPDMPGRVLSTLLLAVFGGLLVLQPDYGQTILVTAVWGLMLFLTGISWRWMGGLMLCATGAMVTAYLTVSHVADRINSFIDRESGDTYQVDAALQSFATGGVLGAGPGEGTIKRILPDAHSDFIFAVAGEEFGMLACLVLLGLFTFCVIRAMHHSLAETDPFLKLATIGLAAMVGLQAMINMAVNVALLPAKGMTLPFISYGGSSLISVAFAMGLVLALTRRRPAVRSVRPQWDGRIAASARA